MPEQADGRTLTPAEALRQAADAAANGDPMGMLAALYQAPVLDGLVRRIAGRFRSIPEDEIHDIVAAAADALYECVRRGEHVRNVAGFLWTVAYRKAQDFCEARRMMQPIGLDLIGVATEEETDASCKPLPREEMRTQALAVARSLLPRLGQQNLQAVMDYIFDAVAADRPDVPNQEIAEALGLSPNAVKVARHRGFQRLERICREEGLLSLPPLDDLASSGAEEDDGQVR